MKSNFFNQLILPAALLSATIIGAGIFSLPFVFQKAGLIAGLFYLLIFSAVFVFIHLRYADIISKTAENHRFAGYAETYLGKSGKWLAILMTIVGMFFALTVYLILSKSFIDILFPSLADTYKILAFWFFGSLAVFLGIKRLTISEFCITFGIGAIILIIFVFGSNNLDQTISSVPFFNLQYIFLPYGAVLFALSGRAAIPTVLGYFRKNNLPSTSIKSSIVLGTLFPAFIYAVFVLAILNLSGNIVSQDSVSGLIGRLPFWTLEILGILGIISLWSSYIVIGRDIKKSLGYDLNLPKLLIALIVVFAPIILYFSGFQNFLKLVGLTGGIFMGLEGIFIVLIRQKAVQKKTLLDYVLLAIFIGGIVWTIIY